MVLERTSLKSFCVRTDQLLLDGPLVFDLLVTLDLYNLFCDVGNKLGSQCTEMWTSSLMVDPSYFYLILFQVSIKLRGDLRTAHDRDTSAKPTTLELLVAN